MCQRSRRRATAAGRTSRRRAASRGLWASSASNADRSASSISRRHRRRRRGRHRDQRPARRDRASELLNLARALHDDLREAAQPARVRTDATAMGGAFGVGAEAFFPGTA
jgi:hypothetical protein